MRLKGKVSVITGGASGIGAACAERFAAEGSEVAIIDLNSADAAVFRADVTNEAAVASAMRAIIERYGRIDVLVNNAGIPGRQPIESLSEEVWTRVLDVSLKGAFLCSKHALPHFPASGGSIIHISSVAGIVGMRNRPAYASAKAALIALARNMALDYASRNVRVNCVCPGFVRTPLVAAIAADPERWARMEGLHPLGRVGEPSDIAAAVLWLASDEARWVTGASLVVDGGFSAGHNVDV